MPEKVKTALARLISILPLEEKAAMLRRITLTVGLLFLCIIHATAQGASEKIKAVIVIMFISLQARRK